MDTEEQIKELNKRIELFSDTDGKKDIITFSEVKISEEQLNIIAPVMMGWTGEHLHEYYRGKIHGELLLSITEYVTREDYPDIQYLFDLGVKALKMGIELSEPESNNT